MRPSSALHTCPPPPGPSTGCRQQTRISAIETELQKLQREMAAIKLENERLKAKVGMGLHTAHCVDWALLTNCSALSRRPALAVAKHLAIKAGVGRFEAKVRMLWSQRATHVTAWHMCVPFGYPQRLSCVLRFVPRP